jgi:pSer/pThr/pTyr-binding forkhead associated (FHA) protein
LFLMSFPLTDDSVRYKLKHRMIEEDDMTLIYKLIMKSGPEAEKIYKLEKDEFVIGRELINDLIISDPEVSRKHARLFKKNEQYYVEDLNSTNGTYHAGKQITRPSLLKSGDLIDLGKSVVLEFVAEEVGGISEMESSAEEAPEKQEGTKEIKKTSLKRNLKKSKQPKPELEPAESAEPVKEPIRGGKLQNLPSWLKVLLIVLLFLIVFCVIPLLIIEWTNQWCNLFGAFFNQIQPGVCP